MKNPFPQVIFKDILKEGCNDDTEHLTVQIGGSMDDLVCLLEADIGIVIGPCLPEYGVEAISSNEGVIPEKKGN